MTRSWTSWLAPLTAGLLLGATGWWAAGFQPSEPWRHSSQIVVRPVEAKVSSAGSAAWTADPARQGRFEVPEGRHSVEVRANGVPPQSLEFGPEPTVRCLRLPSARATLSLSLSPSPPGDWRLRSLPSRDLLPLTQGQTRLEAGHHELLLEVDGCLPERLSLDLQPGQRLERTVKLQPLPGFPSGLPPSALPRPSRPLPPPVVPNRPSSPVSDSPPSWRPDPRPPVRPAPRFTPVPPPPAPRVPKPVQPLPVFTPVAP